MITYKTEQYSEGKYDVITTGDYPRRIGHIVRNKSMNNWHAERGPVDLGYHPTKKAAIKAIDAEYNRPHSEDNPIPLSKLQ